MHINWGFWGALLGVATLDAVSEQRQRNGDELAKRLIMAAGTGDDQEFYGTLAPYIGKFLGSPNSVWVSAFDAATEMEKLNAGQISSAPHVLRFRDWCRTLV